MLGILENCTLKVLIEQFREVSGNSLKLAAAQLLEHGVNHRSTGKTVMMPCRLQKKGEGLPAASPEKIPLFFVPRVEVFHKGRQSKGSI